MYQVQNSSGNIPSGVTKSGKNFFSFERNSREKSTIKPFTLSNLFFALKKTSNKMIHLNK